MNEYEVSNYIIKIVYMESNVSLLIGVWVMFNV